MRTNLLQLLLLGVLLFPAPQLNAQVTIGSFDDPIEGALLDLKENNQLGKNSTKGLLLPRVNLEAADKLKMTGLEVDQSEYLSHAGLTVYNLTELKTPSDADRCKPIVWTTQLSKGVNVWDGQKWNLIGKQPLDEAPAIEGVEVLKDIEGNEYLTMYFGIAGRWMTQSLRSKTFDTESGISLTFPVAPGSGLNSEVHWGYPNLNNKSVTDPEFYNKNTAIGLLYNGSAVFGQPYVPENTKMQGICPNGWYVPTYADYAQLIKEVLLQDPDGKYRSDKSKEQSIYDIYNGCDGVAIIDPTQANSKPAWAGGFDLTYIGWLWRNIIQLNSDNGTVQWLSDPSSVSKVYITNINTNDLVFEPSHWTSYAETNPQTIVRCKKK